MKKKKTPARRLHDFYSGFLVALGRVPRATCCTTNAAGLHSRPLVAEGETLIDNGPEHRFYEGAVPLHIPHRWPARELCRIENAWLTGDQGQIFLKDGSYLHICPSQHRLDPRKVRRPIRFGARTLDFPVFHLTGRDHENHGHFLLQHLPRWQAARHLVEKIDGLRILVPPGHLKWQRRYLELFGVNPEHVIEGTHGTLFCPELYYVPMLWQDNYLCSPAIHQDIAEGFRRVMTSSAPVLPAVWLSREDAPNKKLINESALVNIFRSEIGPVEVIKLSQTPLQSQVERVGRARVIVGAQGQGLTTALFAKGSSLIVLEAGKELASYSWCSAYRDMAILAGNRSLRLISGGGRDSEGNWLFPEGKFRAEISRANRLLST
jgi:capsular polysaccharide biosynthesis protein